MSLPINIEDLLHRNKVESNRDFLKELDLTEGRCTGIPTIQDGLAKNGSPRALSKPMRNAVTSSCSYPYMKDAVM